MWQCPVAHLPPPYLGAAPIILSVTLLQYSDGALSHPPRVSPQPVQSRGWDQLTQAVIWFKLKKSFPSNYLYEIAPFFCLALETVNGKMSLPLHSEQIHSLFLLRGKYCTHAPLLPLSVTNPHLATSPSTPGSSIEVHSLYSHIKDKRWVWINFRKIQVKTWKSRKVRK